MMALSARREPVSSHLSVCFHSLVFSHPLSSSNNFFMFFAMIKPHDGWWWFHSLPFAKVNQSGSIRSWSLIVDHHRRQQQEEERGAGGANELMYRREVLVADSNYCLASWWREKGTRDQDPLPGMQPRVDWMMGPNRLKSRLDSLTMIVMMCRLNATGE